GAAEADMVAQAGGARLTAGLTVASGATGTGGVTEAGDLVEFVEQVEALGGRLDLQGLVQREAEAFGERVGEGRLADARLAGEDQGLAEQQGGLDRGDQRLVAEIVARAGGA